MATRLGREIGRRYGSLDHISTHSCVPEAGAHRKRTSVSFYKHSSYICHDLTSAKRGCLTFVNLLLAESNLQLNYCMEERTPHSWLLKFTLYKLPHRSLSPFTTRANSNRVAR